MQRFDLLIGKDSAEPGALDVDFPRREVILVLARGRELRLSPEQAEQLGAGLLKSAHMLRRAAHGGVR